MHYQFINMSIVCPIGLDGFNLICYGLYVTRRSLTKPFIRYSLTRLFCSMIMDGLSSLPLMGILLNTWTMGQRSLISSLVYMLHNVRLYGITLCALSIFASCFRL